MENIVGYLMISAMVVWSGHNGHIDGNHESQLDIILEDKFSRIQIWIPEECKFSISCTVVYQILTHFTCARNYKNVSIFGMSIFGISIFGQVFPKTIDPRIDILQFREYFENLGQELGYEGFWRLSVQKSQFQFFLSKFRENVSIFGTPLYLI